MRLRLCGIKTAGLRCAELNLQIDPTIKFTFLQMPNGTGKTTLSDCLRAVLSGEAVSWSADHIAGMRKTEGPTDSGLFEARFVVDGQDLAVGINFDFSTNTCNYYTTQQRGRRPRHDLPPTLARFAEPDFVRLYIFDAELPHQLLDSRSDRASTAIDAFYQLYVLQIVNDGLDRLLREVVDERAGAETTASTEHGLARLRNQLDELTARKTTLEATLTNHLRLLARVGAQFDEKNAELEQRLADVSAYRQRRDDARTELQEAERRLSTALADELGRLQRPLDAYSAGRVALLSLAEALDSLRLPESTSRSFFHELADQSHCICGRPIGDAEREAIESAATALLEDDSAGVINTLKRAVAASDRDPVCRHLHDAAEELTNLVVERDRCVTVLDQLREAASDDLDESARALNSEVVELTQRRQKIASIIEEMERDPRPDDNKESDCIAWFDQQVQRLTAAVTKISKTVRLRQRRDLLQAVTNDARTRAAAAARSQLVDATNRQLEDLLPGEQVRLAAIDPALRLENRAGLNLGATLSVGYSFLTALFRRGNHSFPFVVDAPAMGLDGLARTALARVLPDAVEQFVGFVLDNERDFVDAVYRTCPNDCAFVTIFSDSSRNKPLADQAALATHISPDGSTYVIEGHEFFRGVIWVEDADA